MFTENFFELLLNNEAGWRVEKAAADVKSEEVRIHITCDLNQFDHEGETCALYDHAPPREWRHLDTLQYKTYLVCALPRARCHSGKIKGFAN